MLYIANFKEAMARAGIPCPDSIVADGMLHRSRTEGDLSPNYWYVLYADGIPAGAFGCWKRGISQRWCAKDPKDLPEPERAAVQKRIEQAMAQRAQEQNRRHRIARERALKVWEKAKPETGDHPYLVRKRVKPHGIRRVDDLLIIIPMYDTEGVLQCLQLITPKGKKGFMHGGKVSGHHFIIGRPGKTVCIAEGFATAASIHEATGHPVAVAFTAGNLKPVAEALRNRYHEAQLIICADNDQWTDDNVGLKKAREAAIAVTGLLAVPQFKDRSSKPTDFNDLERLEGAEEVKRQIDNAQPVQLSREDIDSAIARLAALSPIDYERCRQEEADGLGVRVGTLDEEVKKARTGTSEDSAQGTPVLFENVEPWADTVNGAELLNDLAASARRHIVLPEHGETVLALWTVFTYFIDVVRIAPILALYSPEKRCGKTTVLSWLGRLVHRRLLASNMTPAVIFRAIQKWRPTLLIDEADTFIASSDELRGVLNSGHTRDTAYVLRVVGDNHEPQQFSTWGAKAIAKIGKLPDTLEDRSLIMKMRRKFRTDKVETLRHTDNGVFETLCRRCMRFAKDNEAALRAVRPKAPDTLNDRAADNWEPLLAIADIAGGDWRERAREAARALSGNQQVDDSHGVALLTDIRQVFLEKGKDRIASRDLLKALLRMEGRPWAEFRHGKEMTKTQLANVLRPFGIFPRTIRMGAETPKGYFRDQFEDAFARYLPATDPPQRHNAVEQGSFGDSPSATASSCGGSESTDTACETSRCGVVADEPLLSHSETERARRNRPALDRGCEG